MSSRSSGGGHALWSFTAEELQQCPPRQATAPVFSDALLYAHAANMRLLRMLLPSAEWTLC